MADMLRFRRVTGEQVEAEARVDDTEFPAGQYLMSRWVWLEDGTELRQHRVANALQRLDGDDRQRREGYDRLDNEILTGRRLYEVAGWGTYPPEVACLYGDEATSADPYTLFEGYHGEPLREVGTHLLDEEFQEFLVSLLTGLCWLAGAGIAHRAINPDTVLWDSQRRRAQITDFSHSTVFGTPRTPVTGSPSWVAKEQRPGEAFGMVGERDDIWAAGRLIFYVRNQGEELVARNQLADGGLDELLDGVFGPPQGRPTASELLVDRLGRGNPVPRGASGSTWLQEGRRRFLEARARKHPGAPLPPGFSAGGDELSGPQAGGRGAGPSVQTTGAAAAAGAVPPPDAQEQAEAGRPKLFPWRRGD